MQKRTKLIIWLYSLKQVNKLKHYGLIHYVSKKMKYVVMYVDQEKTSEVTEKLSKLAFIREIEALDDKVIDDNFENTFDKVNNLTSEQISIDEGDEN